MDKTRIAFGFDSWKVTVLMAAAFAARLALAMCSTGSNDAGTWADLGNYILERGLFAAYRQLHEANHPPLPLLWSVLSVVMGRHSGLSASFWMKLPGMAADTGTTYLIYRFAPRRPLLAAAVFAFNPVMVLVAGYHCNTDTLCADLCLACAIAFDERLLFLAGAALGAAINVKLIPGMLILPLGLMLRWSELRRFIGGLSLGVFPFVPTLMFASQGFLQHAIRYNSNLENWGVILLLKAATSEPHLGQVSRQLISFYWANGKAIVFTLTAACGLVGRVRGWHGSSVVAVAIALFLVATPGFGIQYVAYVVPALAITSLNFSVVYGLSAGVFALAIYSGFSDWSFPLSSDVQHFNAFQSLLGLLSWSVLVRFAFVELNGRVGGDNAKRPRISAPDATI